MVVQLLILHVCALNNETGALLIHNQIWQMLLLGFTGFHRD